MLRSDWWQVQAFWTFNGERQYYAPAFLKGRRVAERTADQMRENLWHFAELQIVIRPATIEEVDEDRLRRAELADSPTPVMHLMLDLGGKVTACGTKGNWSRLDMWDRSSAPKCPVCSEAASSARDAS